MILIDFTIVFIYSNSVTLLSLKIFMRFVRRLLPWIDRTIDSSGIFMATFCVNCTYHQHHHHSRRRHSNQGTTAYYAPSLHECVRVINVNADVKVAVSGVKITVLR